ncbi:transcriptional regulator [Rhodococcus spelaei]|uniref:Transcriptional regulator n=1 Tax=Rhodococcus spelaei TaxID=2546320 RepID=A0A541B7I1_9NOCA|nr:BTAD domain-containing putative transcriptional regulator [Rhodococcus spelaei]TQF68287.1 transcriptional regulator [Rhodococcus spelaei]
MNVVQVAPIAGPSRHQLSVVDGFELRRGGLEVPVAHSAQRLLAFLALQARPVLRSYVSGSLWPDSDIAHANASLRSALWRLPTLLQSPVVSATATHLALSPSVEVDVQQVIGWAKTLLKDTGDDTSSWTFQEIDRLGGELLPDWYDDWVTLERERFRQLRLHALEALSDRLTAAERYGEALHAALSAVAIEPLRESAHCRVIAVHLREGNRTDALDHYRSYERLLATELSLTPSATMRSLIASCFE